MTNPCKICGSHTPGVHRCGGAVVINLRRKRQLDYGIAAIPYNGHSPARGCEEDCDRSRAYTPPSNITPDRLRALSTVKHVGRDIESLRRYHAAHLKGRTDDDALKDKFGSGANAKRAGTEGAQPKVPSRDLTHPAPTPQPVDAGWPKWRKWSLHITRFDTPRTGRIFELQGGQRPLRSDNYYTSDSGEAWFSESEALAWLDANGHRAYADELRARGRLQTPIQDKFPF